MRYLLIAILSYFPLLLYASADFIGTYECTGYDPYLKKAYAGTVIVTQQNTVYKVEMNYNTGEKYIATGGQYDPTLLSVVFQNTDNLKQVGLEQYSLSNDKNTMAGYWVYLGKDKLGKEQCTRVH